MKRVRQKPRSTKDRKPLKRKGASAKMRARQKHGVSPHVADTALAMVRLAIFPQDPPSSAPLSGVGPADIAPLLALADVLSVRAASDAFNSLVSSGYPKDELELDLRTAVPIGLSRSDQRKPQYSFGLITKYSHRERKQKARLAMGLAKWAAGNPVPNFPSLAKTLSGFAKEILKPPPRGHVLSLEDLFLLKFLAKVRDRTGAYQYTQVSVLVRMVLIAMFDKGLLTGEQRKDEMWSEAHLKQLVHRRKKVLPLIYRKSVTPDAAQLD